MVTNFSVLNFLKTILVGGTREPTD